MSIAQAKLQDKHILFHLLEPATINLICDADSDDKK